MLILPCLIIQLMLGRRPRWPAYVEDCPVGRVHREVFLVARSGWGADRPRP